MKPTIDFHGITRIELATTRTLKRSSDGSPFSVRDLILTDEDGLQFRVGLFSAKTAEQLVVHDADAEVPTP